MNVIVMTTIFPVVKIAPAIVFFIEVIFDYHSFFAHPAGYVCSLPEVIDASALSWSFIISNPMLIVLIWDSLIAVYANSRTLFKFL